MVSDYRPEVSKSVKVMIWGELFGQRLIFDDGVRGGASGVKQRGILAYGWFRVFLLKAWAWFEGWYFWMLEVGAELTPEGFPMFSFRG